MKSLPWHVVRRVVRRMVRNARARGDETIAAGMERSLADVQAVAEYLKVIRDQERVQPLAPDLPPDVEKRLKVSASALPVPPPLQ